MLEQLPNWVVSDTESVRVEVAEWIGTTPAQRWRLARACARDAMWAMRASGMRDRILQQEDPLPASTIEALAKLRQQAGWPRGR